MFSHFSYVPAFKTTVPTANPLPIKSFPVSQFTSQLSSLFKSIKDNLQRVIESDVYMVVTYEGHNFSIRNGWLYSGDEALTNNLEYSKNLITAKRTIVNSDTRGLPVEMIYKLHIVPKQVEQPKPKKIIKPTTVIEEGLSVAKTPDDEYFENMGLVKDKETKQWRKPTPQEYAEFSKKVAEKKKGKKK
jgi:hypothetical protein